ncbi:MAG TPA: thiamine pyrophosphate-dependent enzyme, partial [Phycisphaerales bacterium]|nr:thiamine pyrophosphate-dependent enzyme [Phycisphaerales bacterium]
MSSASSPALSTGTMQNANPPATTPDLYSITASKVHLGPEGFTGVGRRTAGSQRPSAAVSNATLIRWLKDMVAIREFENRCAQAYQQAKIGGFCHLYIGQEAVA